MGADGSKDSMPSTPADADRGSDDRGMHAAGVQSQPTSAQHEPGDSHPAPAESPTETALEAAASLPCDELNTTPERPKTWDDTDGSAGGRLSDMDEIENLIVVLEHGGGGGGAEQKSTAGHEPRPLHPSQQTASSGRPPLPPLLSRSQPPLPAYRAEPNVTESPDDGTTPSLRRSGKESGSAKQAATTADIFDPLKFKDANKSPRLHDANGSTEIARKSSPDIVKVKSVSAKLEPQYNEDEVELLVSIERDLIR